MTRRVIALGGISILALAAAGGLVWLALSQGPQRVPTKPSASTPEGERTGPAAPAPRPALPPAAPGGVARGTGAAAGGVPEAPPSIAGLVVDAATRRPLARARVAARPKGGGAVRGVETDGAGRFALRGLGAGTYEVMAAAEGYLAPRSPVERAVAAPPTPTAAPLEIALERGLEVRGRVVDTAGRPAAGVTVELQGAPQDRFVGAFAPIVTGADGAFTIAGVPAGKGFRVEARAPGFAEGVAPVPEVAPPAGAEGVVVTLRRYRITGRAVAAQGMPLPPSGVGVTIEVATPDAGHEAPSAIVARVPLDAEGAFQAHVPRPGTYLVRAARGGLEQATATALASATVRVTVPESGDAPAVSLLLERLALLEGRVVDAQGRAVASASVHVRTGGTAFEEADALSDADGRFRLEVLPRPHALRARRAGYAPRALDAVAPGGPPFEVVLDATPGAAPVSGRFRGADGRPLAGLDVRLELGDGEEETSARTDAEGNLDLSSLAPGVYTQSFVEPGGEGRELRVWTRQVTIEAGRAADLGFDDPGARGSIRGLVRGAPRAGQATVNIEPAQVTPGRFGYLAAAAVDQEGAFAFASVPPGRYRLRVASDRGDETTDVEVNAGVATQVTVEIEGR